MTQPTESAPRRAKHLIDPTQPRKQATPEDLARLEKVQRRVLTALVVTTIVHLSVGLVIAAAYVSDDERVAQVGLCVLGGAFGVCAVASGFAIHRRSPLTPWLLVGFLPTAVGLAVILS
ncbi:hypothetical protein [Nocardioides sp. R-C-SC26]|uniref:hypothetical protein n=1 Tax=Nocardioides sp. R-C-SC26 TaxID=2870414 RepID=UPI001E5B8A46|nr:hypothetical protein [Nocardioides sp. R-C-SC26]